MLTKAAGLLMACIFIGKEPRKSVATATLKFLPLMGNQSKTKELYKKLYSS